MQAILKEVENYIRQLFTESPFKDRVFYDYRHTLKTVDHTNELLENQNDNDLDVVALRLSCWFLFLDDVHSQEKTPVKSEERLQRFLKEKSADQNLIEKASELLKAAWSLEEPKSEEEKIIKDARSGYYASGNFDEVLELLLIEVNRVNGTEMSINELRENYINILRNEHRFYSDYALENWQEQKENNVMDLVAAIAKSAARKKKEKLKVNLKNESPERAIQSLYRTQLRNHLKLSDIADTKANILLSVNAIIISLLLANLIPKLGNPTNSYLTYPTVIFVVFSIISMIMSVAATRPKIDNNSLVDQDINEKDINYLFFGNFHSLEPNEFKEKLRSIIVDKQSIYDSLSMDLYYLGKVLKKKYQLLRWTYTVFMFGIILSVIAFAIALKYYGMDQELIEAVTPDTP
ncbi:phosphohydrolase [Euzebyella marina]|uniref:Phosphohydrolase n=1 Tax=Euzebyella marina TaxID=1761453 RepID=A0A3G2L6V3_9FLAO|nr:Pycsar system effector family protein [Euzebyella marina]AYN67978.1 phosphohydrolase [Euzebyella marina]